MNNTIEHIINSTLSINSNGKIVTMDPIRSSQIKNNNHNGNGN